MSDTKITFGKVFWPSMVAVLVVSFISLILFFLILGGIIGGLSDFGRQAIAEMNRQGVLVDIAHSGWQTSLEAAKVSTKPVVASHTTAAGLHHHIRSKPDEVLKALAESGGYAGICCISQFLGGKCDINAFLDHIDYVVNWTNSRFKACCRFCYSIGSFNINRNY